MTRQTIDIIHADLFEQYLSEEDFTFRRKDLDFISVFDIDVNDDEEAHLTTILRDEASM